MTSKIQAKIKKDRKPEKKPTYIHMDNKKDVLTMELYLKLL